MVATLVETANAFFATYAPDVEPVTVKDVESYYKEDAFIWSLYLGFRRFDRTLHRLTGRSYPYLLPGKIKR
jgi:hypothetical protein